VRFTPGPPNPEKTVADDDDFDDDEPDLVEEADSKTTILMLDVCGAEVDVEVDDGLRRRGPWMLSRYR
jgi:hypothetical protein